MFAMDEVSCATEIHNEPRVRYLNFSPSAYLLENKMNIIGKLGSTAPSVIHDGHRIDDDSGKAGRILVVDDDPTMREMIVSYLEDSNLSADGASSPYELRRHLAAADPSLIILDIVLGEHDGLDLLREIRTRSDVPVILVTGQRRDEIDRVVGLELGADDYVATPFSLRELLARIRAILRRHEIGRAARARGSKPGGYRFDGWQIECPNRRLVNPDGIEVPLTNGEYALLLAFVEEPQRPLTREQLLQACRVHEDVFDRSVDVQILRLRRKLETDPSAPQIIQTLRGVGYLFSPQVEQF
jgi:two-component system OmpR family response regulator